MASLTLPAERRSLERKAHEVVLGGLDLRTAAEVTPRSSANPDDAHNDEPPAEPMAVALQSELARGAALEIELEATPIVLQSDLALRVVTAALPSIELTSPLARRAAAIIEGDEAAMAAKAGKETALRPAAARGLAY